MSESTKSTSYVSAQAVANHAGVSRSAVSRTFTDGASVSPETRRRVLLSAEALGYHVNHLARGLSGERSNIVSLVIADMANPHQTAILQSLIQRLQESDRMALVISTRGDDASVSNALRQSLNYRADATVVLSGAPSSSLVDTCRSNGQRVVLVNRSEDYADVGRIFVDSTRAAQEAFAMLRRAGCRRCAVVSSTAGTSSILARERAFEAAAAAAGREARIVREGPTLYRTGVLAAERLLAGDAPPDGVFCVTDTIAMGVLDTARHGFGRAVPEELCVVGFDDIQQAGWASYDLTTFRQPVEAIAEHVVAHITSTDPDLAAPQLVRLDAAAVWRGTVRKGPAGL